MSEGERPVWQPGDPIEVGGYDNDIREDILVAPGQAALFPKQQEVVRMRDAETDPEHRAIEVGPNAECSCGWTGEGWAQHFSEATRSR